MAISPTQSSGLSALVPEQEKGRGTVAETPVVLEIGGDGSYTLNRRRSRMNGLRKTHFDLQEPRQPGAVSQSRAGA